MTNQPPPPGSYPPPRMPPPPRRGYPPPPPPRGGGYPPPPPPHAAGGYPPRVQHGSALPSEAYTPWVTRVLAWIIDFIPAFIILGIGFGILEGTRETMSTFGRLSALFIALIAFAYVIWNSGYRQGITGSSIGKSIMKIKIVAESTRLPLGSRMSVVRELVYLAPLLACGILWLIAVLYPLWDTKRQTLIDKIFNTICLPL